MAAAGQLNNRSMTYSKHRIMDCGVWRNTPEESDVSISPPISRCKSSQYEFEQLINVVGMGAFFFSQARGVERATWSIRQCVCVIGFIRTRFARLLHDWISDSYSGEWIAGKI
jgi:hypothetical protein